MQNDTNATLYDPYCLNLSTSLEYKERDDSSRCPVQFMSFKSMLSASKSQQLSSRVFKKYFCVFHRSQNSGGFPVFVLSDLK